MGKWRKLLGVCLAFTLVVSLGLTSVEAKDNAASGKAVDIVAVDGGLVRGVAADVKGVQVFKGIPYAGSTAGENRWKAPQPVKSWEGVKLCDSWGDQVLQDPNANTPNSFYGIEFNYDNNFAVKGTSEDSLLLNVYTPAKKTNEKLPVLFYIHGGGNDHGNASQVQFNASKLADKGIIVVTVQYRLGVFGFLALDELSKESENGVSGNYAILDLIQALKWVNRNIAGFGGNSGEVTIAGQSAGAFNVTSLLRTPLAKGLFNRAVVQSGFNGFLTAKGAPVYKTLAEQEAISKAAITKAFGKEMTLQELRDLPAEDYLTKYSKADSNQILYKALTSAATSVVLDGYVFTEESVDLTRKGALDGIDIMIGGNSDEMTSLAGSPNGTMALDNFASTMQKKYGADFAQAYNPANPTEAYRLNLRSSSDSNLQGYILSAEYARAHNKNMKAYVYYFNRALPGRSQDFYGAFHSAELWYMFNSIRNVQGQRPWTDYDYKLADMMSSYYANFVKHGNPNGSGLPVWQESTSATGGAFMSWSDEKAESVSATQYPFRDALNRKTVMTSYGMSESDFKLGQIH